MLDNEHEHMNEVMNEFGEFKARIASLIVNHQTTGLTSITMYTPITLGAPGVPIFASPTIGQLNYEPSGTTNSSGVSIDFAYDTGGGIVNVNNSGGGKLELYAPNRYYVQQWVNGALLVRQTDGQSMRAVPSINVDLMGSGQVNLTFTQIDLIGLNSSYSGTGSVGATTQLKYLDYQYYSFEQFQEEVGEVRLTFVTMYNSSWVSFLSDICSSAGLVEGATGDYTLTDTQVTDEIHRVVFTILDCGSMIYNRAYVSTTIKF